MQGYGKHFYCLLGSNGFFFFFSFYHQAQNFHLHLHFLLDDNEVGLALKLVILCAIVDFDRLR